MVSYPVYFIDITIWQQDKICKNDIPKYRVFFLTHSLSRLAHQKCFDWPLPKLSKCWNHIHFARHLGVFRSEGGPVWDSSVFLETVSTLNKIRRRGGQLKKTPCIMPVITYLLPSLPSAPQFETVVNSASTPRPRSIIVISATVDKS